MANDDDIKDPTSDIKDPTSWPYPSDLPLIGPCHMKVLFDDSMANWLSFDIKDSESFCGSTSTDDFNQRSILYLKGPLL